jgi:hypothetical protein
MTTALSPQVQALLDVAGGSQRDHVLAAQELRKGTRRQQRGRAISESLRG